MNTKPSMLIAQITDTHLFAEVEPTVFGVQTYKSLQAVVEKLTALQPQPDILLLTGDLSQDESSQSYDRLTSLIAPLNIPAYWLPGNHDNLQVMEQVLQSPLNPTKSFHAGGWNFLLLSSLIPGCVHGEISQQSLDWLEFQLEQNPNSPTLVAIHHPPCSINSEWMDKINLRNHEEFLAVCDRYPQIKLVIFGHIHQEFDTRRGNVRYLGSPSTCVQFQPQSKEFAIDKQQPGFRLINLFADGTYNTEIVRAESVK